MPDDQPGALLDRAPLDWQILQQDARGLADLPLAGRWRAEGQGTVEVRLVGQDTGVPVARHLDWQAAETRPDGTWDAALEHVPAGGLYHLETRLNPTENLAGEWSTRGDMRHFLGVGDLWVIAGQSNAAGYGRGPYLDPPALGVHLFRNAETWALASHPMNDSTDTRHPANREGGNPAHSPFLGFGRLLLAELGHPVGLVQTALGGSALAPWNPTEPGPSPLFENMLHCVERVGGRARGILWYQGESDTGTAELAATYADRFTHAVGAWREALGAPDLPVLTVQLNRAHQLPGDGLDARWSALREAQRQVARSLGGVGVVPSLDCLLADGIHTAPGGNLLLGERLARAALGAVYGRPVACAAPDLQTAHALHDGATVELTFAPVTSRMGSIDPEAHPFRVEDAEGIVPVERIAYPGDARILLVLARPLAADAVVHGAWGTDPATAPLDVERMLPMLAFSGVPIASDSRDS
ncbi:MAG: sialate O-acetylesterase [Planctomycetota bacterium]